MFEKVQIISDNGKKRFAVITYKDYLELKRLLSDEKKLEDYLDYLHIQHVKSESKVKFALEEVKAEIL